MESSEQKGGFGTVVLVLLLVLAFIVGTALFAFVGYQFLSGGQRGQVAQAQATATTLPSPTPTATVIVPTSTPVPTVKPPATTVPAIVATATAVPTIEATATPAHKPGSKEDLPQTGVGSLASAASVLLAAAALGSRWLRRRS